MDFAPFLVLLGSLVEDSLVRILGCLDGSCFMFELSNLPLTVESMHLVEAEPSLPLKAPLAGNPTQHRQDESKHPCQNQQQ